MRRDKWIVGVRNKIASLAMECDSAAAIEGSKMTNSERDELQGKLRNICKWIDKKLEV